MILYLDLHGCGCLQWMFFVLCVKGSEREGLLQVLLTPQTKLRGRGKSVRWQEQVIMWVYLDYNVDIIT